MDNHGRKMLPPIIVTVVIVLYYIAYFAILMHLLPGFAKILLGLIPIVIAGIMIYVCIERINEIQGGEEDDLSKY